MKNMQGKIIIQTTLGDLIAALTEEAVSFVGDKKKANELVADALNDLLAKADAATSKWH